MSDSDSKDERENERGKPWRHQHQADEYEPSGQIFSIAIQWTPAASSPVPEVKVPGSASPKTTTAMIGEPIGSKLQTLLEGPKAKRGREVKEKLARQEVRKSTLDYLRECITKRIEAKRVALQLQNQENLTR